MKKINIEGALGAMVEGLAELVADYLDVNRQHIRIEFIDPQICGEDGTDWDKDPDDAAEGVEWEAYYHFAYSFRKDKRTIDYEKPVDMIWKHVDSDDYTYGFNDSVMTTEEFDKLFEDKKHDPKSVLWYEGDENE